MAGNETTKVIRASSQGEASVEIAEDSTALIGNKDNFIIIDKRGITLKGKISVVTSGEQTREGALFVKLPDMLQMIPSTLVSPLPHHIPMPPAHGLTNITKDLAFFLALLV